MFKGVFFDLGWTLMRPETGDWMLTKKFREYYPEELFITVPKDVWYKALQTASQPLMDHHQMTSRKEEEEAFTGFYYDLISNVPGLTITKDIAHEISYDRTYHYEKYIMLDGVKELLETLKKHQIKIATLSDTWPSMEQILEELGYEHYFDSFTYSYQYGLFKPDPVLFEKAIEKMQLPPEECIFVDDLEANVLGMAQFGVQPLLSCVKDPTKVHPTIPCITKPIDLLRFMNLT